jgi:hypothetical protein
MAALTEPARAETHGRFMREETTTFGAVTKADLRAAVNALDDFMEANAAAINAAIPQPARSALTAAQKARLLALVVLRRWGG